MSLGTLNVCVFRLRPDYERLVMDIKAIAHAAQQHLKASTSTQLPKTHLYELIAAACGFGSYAALLSQAVLVQASGRATFDSPLLLQRCRKLGYTPGEEAFAQRLIRFLAGQHLHALRIDAIVDKFHGKDVDELVFWSSDRSAIAFTPALVGALRNAASAGNAQAHYALALFHAIQDRQLPGGSAYWHQQQAKGMVLQGVEKEWADAYTARRANSASYTHHLKTAADLGDKLALFDLARASGDRRFFEAVPAPDAALDLDPAEVAMVAYELELPGHAWRWIRLAAEGGDIQAMRELITEGERHDLEACWTWVHLARLHGTDLTEDDLHAVDENGFAYDDDVGGPIYVGGRKRLELPLLDKAQDARARAAAQAIFRRPA
jgi:hypothetical protein